MRPDPREERAVLFLLAELESVTGLPTVDQGKPDAANRSTPDVDRIAALGDRLLAIEHKTLDTVFMERTLSAEIKGLLDPVKTELRGIGNGFFYLAISSPPEASRREQQCWRDVMIEVCRYEFPRMQPDSPVVVVKDARLPFELKIRRSGNSLSGIRLGLLPPADWDEDESRREAIRAVLKGANDKLRQYKESGRTTIVLLDVRDVENENVHETGARFREVVDGDRRLVDATDHVFYVDSFELHGGGLPASALNCLMNRSTIWPDTIWSWPSNLNDRRPRTPWTL